MLKNKLLFCFYSILLISCGKTTESTNSYLPDIGDTIFNPAIDRATFEFCDSSNVLHKRAYVKYAGGTRAFEEDIIKMFKFKPEYEVFTGYFIVRFAVNCKNESGRYRWEIVDENFEETTCPKNLENHILSILKDLKKWQHPIYRGNSYDGYTYKVIKIESGKIIRS